MQSPGIGDCIGVESSTDLKSDVDTPPHRGGRNSRRNRRREAAKKQYPPPISWLARTDNHPSHMPWVMKKYYTDDGRLIIREERMKHHEYFLADRSNGRLVLNLVHLDDAIEDNRRECHAPEEDSPADRFDCEEIDGGDEEISDPTAIEEVVSECYKYNGMGVNPCGGFVATAAAAAAMFRPPVHI